MKYVAINPEQIECTNCASRFKSDASFCGFCGAQAIRKTVVLNAITDLDGRRKTPIELGAINPDFGSAFLFEDDDFDEFAPSKKNILGMAVIATSVIAVGIMGYVLFLQASDVKEAVPVVPVVEVASTVVPKAPNLEKKPVKKIRFTLTKRKGARELRAQELLITVNQSRDSRYKSVDKRAQSVLIRLNHAMEQIQKGECETNCFEAVQNGKFSEVHFINREGAPFRLLDVTKRDARLEKTTPHIRANLIVDQLNALVEIKKQPLASNFQMR